MPPFFLFFEISPEAKFRDNVGVCRSRSFWPAATHGLPSPAKLTFDERREPANYGLIPNHDANVTFGFANVDT
jgi:hypothetical protein